MVESVQNQLQLSFIADFRGFILSLNVN